MSKFYVEEYYRTTLHGACTFPSNPTIPFNRLGDLILAFNHRYPTFTLVPQFHCSNEDRYTKIRFVVVHSVMSPEDPEHSWPSAADHDRMYDFLIGFAEACKKECSNSDE